MRFKKLRRAVGISIALFVLIIGIIMISGLTHSQNQNSAVALNPSRNSFVNPNVIQNPTQEQQPSSQPVYHPMLMTGAS